MKQFIEEDWNILLCILPCHWSSGLSSEAIIATVIFENMCWETSIACDQALLSHRNFWHVRKGKRYSCDNLISWTVIHLPTWSHFAIQFGKKQYIYIYSILSPACPAPVVITAGMTSSWGRHCWGCLFPQGTGGEGRQHSKQEYLHIFSLYFILLYIPKGNLMITQYAYNTQGHTEDHKLMNEHVLIT